MIAIRIHIASAAVTDLLRDAIATLTGGLTEYRGKGYWVDAEGALVPDEVITLLTYVPERGDLGRTVVDLARAAARAVGEQAIGVETSAVNYQNREV